MAQASLPFTLTAGSPENVNQLSANLNALLAGVNAVDTSQLDSSSVLVPAGLNGGGSTRRGHCTIATSQSRTNTSYGVLTTPDQVQNVVLASDGILRIGFHAQWQESVAQAARAAVFIGSNQLKTVTQAGGSPVSQEAATGAVANNTAWVLGSSPLGLIGSALNSAHSGDVTTGQLVGAQIPSQGISPGFMELFAAAGTYTVSIMFKSSSGSVTVANRHLWVEAIGF